MRDVGWHEIRPLCWYDLALNLAQQRQGPEHAWSPVSLPGHAQSSRSWTTVHADNLHVCQH